MSRHSSPLHSPLPQQQHFNANEKEDEGDTLHITRPSKKHRDESRSSRSSAYSSRSGSDSGLIPPASPLSPRQGQEQQRLAYGTSHKRNHSGSDHSHYSEEGQAAQAEANDAQEILMPEHDPGSHGLKSFPQSTTPRSERHPSRQSSSSSSMRARYPRSPASPVSEHEWLGHSREASSILPSPPLQEQEDSAPPPNFQASDEYNNIMAEIESAIEQVSVGQPSPYAASFSSSEPPRPGLAVSTPSGLQLEEQKDYMSAGVVQPSGSSSSSAYSVPTTAPGTSVAQPSPSPSYPVEDSEAVQSPVVQSASIITKDEIDAEEIGQPAPLSSPSIYSSHSPSRHKERRASSYVAREPSIRISSPSVDTHGPTASQLAKLRQRRAPLACLEWREVVKRKTPGERALTYAQRINELSRADSGLSLWISLKRQSPLQRENSYQLNVSRRGSLDSASVLSGGQRSAPQRPTQFLRQQSSMDFAMRPDASKATDLTPYAHQAVPTNFNSTTMPYPGVASPPPPQLPQSNRMSTGGFSLQKSGTISGGWSTPMMGAKAAFLSLGRRSSSRAGGLPAPSQTHRPLSASPSTQQFQSLGRPSIQIGGPRSSMAPSDHSNTSARSSPMIAVSRQDVEKLGDILPQASREQLEAYLRKASGDSTLALQCYLEDERTGNLLC